MTADHTGQMLEQARALIDDKALPDVAAWKAANPGGLAIGYMPVYVPRPMFEAIGCLPVAIFGGGDALDIVRGDSFFQSYICHIPRSTIELGLGGHLDLLDGMVFPSICDVIRNLGGMWKMLFPKKYSAYLDLPQNFDLRVGGKFYGLELKRIARELVGIGAKELNHDALMAAIRDENLRREKIEELEKIRRAEPWRIKASEAYIALRLGTRMTAKEHTKWLAELIESVKVRQGRVVDNVRVVLAGSFCEQPPLDLIRALEKAGCDIVDDDFQLGIKMVDGPIEVQDGQDPIDALVSAFIDKGRDTASRYIGNLKKGAGLINRVRQYNADGVIFAGASFCDPALLDQPMLEQALEREKIPFTSFKFAENTGQFQPIREQAGAFSDAVKLWGAAT